MLRLALTDLRRNAGQWLWSLIIVAVAGACSGAQMMITRGALAAARAAGDENMIEGARVFQGWTLTAVSLSAITTPSSPSWPPSSCASASARTGCGGLWA